MAARTLVVYSSLVTSLLLGSVRGSWGIELTLGFRQQPDDVVADRNRPLILNCSAYSNVGPVKISWLHKGVIINESRRQVLSNGSLYFPRVIHQKKSGESDAGDYQCVASNNIGTLVSQSAKLAIANVSRKFAIPPLSQIVEEGDAVRFSCQIVTVPNATYVWQKDREHLPQDDHWVVIKHSGVLLINSVLKSDAGNYRCLASSKNVHRYSSEASLEVNTASGKYYPPKIITPTNYVKAKVGEKVVLECAASGYPLPEISWTDKGNRDSSRIQVIGQGSLLFTKVLPEDSGHYTCNATNQNDENKEVAFVTHRIELQVLVPPEFVKKPKSSLVPSVQTARFECEAAGVPTPQVVWLKNGQPVLNNGRIKVKTNSDLVIPQTASSDSGLYQCVAYNEVGYATANVRLHINTSRDQPDPPTGLRALALSSTAIELSWNASVTRNGLSINAYTVHHAPSNGGDELQKVGRNLSLVIDLLKAYTNYSFYVRAYTERSASDPSEILVWSTKEDVPLGAPSVTLTSYSPTMLHVSWDAMPSYLARGVIDMYKIFCRRKNQPTAVIEELPGDVNEYTITGLRPGTKYEVRVLASTSVGYPNLGDNEWPWVRHEMPAQNMYKVPSSPALDLTVVNSTTILVSWRSADNNNSSELLGFKLSYRRQNCKMHGPFDISSNISQYLLTQLIPQTWYEVHILAYNNYGDGRESVRNILTENSGISTDVPLNTTIVEPPLHLEAMPTSSTSINVSWKDPISNKNISYFTVRYNPVPLSEIINASAVNYLKSMSKEVAVNHLLPYTLYEFSVCSHDQDNTPGPYSSKVACKTGEDIPTAPTYLNWKPLDSHTILLNWQPPTHPNGEITNYFIMYHTERISCEHSEQWVTIEEGGSTLSSKINGLASNTLYYLCVSAKTSVGIGPPTDVITLNIPSPLPKNQTDASSVYNEDIKDPRLGIIVGISIGLSCMVICAVVIAVRNRFLASTMDPHHYVHQYHLHGNGRLMSSHCNGIGHNGNCTTISDSHDVESFIPMLSYHAENGTNHHLDTKGGYPTHGGKINHISHSPIQKTCLTNGHTVRDKPTINIIENPQHLPWDAKTDDHYNGNSAEDAACLRHSSSSNDVDADEDSASLKQRKEEDDDDEEEDSSTVQLDSSSQNNNATCHQSGVSSREGSECESSLLSVACPTLPETEHLSSSRSTLQHAEASSLAQIPS